MANKRKINYGTSYDLTVTYAENGVAQSIVGDTLYLTVKPSYDTDNTDAAALISKTVVVPNNSAAIAGSYTFNLGYTDTDITPNDYVADVVIKRSSTGKRYVLVEETWTIVPTSTNRNT